MLPCGSKNRPKMLPCGSIQKSLSRNCDPTVSFGLIGSNQRIVVSDQSVFRWVSEIDAFAAGWCHLGGYRIEGDIILETKEESIPCTTGTLPRFNMRGPVSGLAYRALMISLTPRQYHICYSCLAVFRLKTPPGLANFTPETLVSSMDEQSSQHREPFRRPC